MPPALGAGHNTRTVRYYVTIINFDDDVTAGARPLTVMDIARS